MNRTEPIWSAGHSAIVKSRLEKDVFPAFGMQASQCYHSNGCSDPATEDRGMWSNRNRCHDQKHL
ncbi:MAG: hypothetical protein NT163_06630 [Chlorobiales bacterium]|nr:hypothetical protein [Chlorobiales bacterium]